MPFSLSGSVFAVAIAATFGLCSANARPGDLDRDGVANRTDPDVDGDGVRNGSDRNVDGGVCLFGPYAGIYVGDHWPNGDRREKDIDGDGLKNDSSAELDIDGDGKKDNSSQELDIDGDGRPDDSWSETDIDGDGRPNHADRDCDGDGKTCRSDRDDDGDGRRDKIMPAAIQVGGVELVVVDLVLPELVTLLPVGTISSQGLIVRDQTTLGGSGSVASETLIRERSANAMVGIVTADGGCMNYSSSMCCLQVSAWFDSLLFVSDGDLTPGTEQSGFNLDDRLFDWNAGFENGEVSSGWAEVGIDSASFWLIQSTDSRRLGSLDWECGIAIEGDGAGPATDAEDRVERPAESEIVPAD